MTMNTTQERNLLQEVVMWLVGVAAFVGVGLVWVGVERMLGVKLVLLPTMVRDNLASQAPLLLFAVALILGVWAMSHIRRTSWGIIRKGAIYGAIVGVWFMLLAGAMEYAFPM